MSAWIGKCWGCGAVVAASVDDDEGEEWVREYDHSRIEGRAVLEDCRCPKRRRGEKDWKPNYDTAQPERSERRLPEATRERLDAVLRWLGDADDTDDNDFDVLREDTVCVLTAGDVRAIASYLRSGVGRVSHTTLSEMRDFYISGPMTGYPEFNYPAFEAAAIQLRGKGHTVYSPHEAFAGAKGLDYADYMREDVRLVCLSRAVAVLPGWEKSKGAALEVHLARVLGLPVVDCLTMEPVALSGVVVGLPEPPKTLPEEPSDAAFGAAMEAYQRTVMYWAPEMMGSAAHIEKLVGSILVAAYRVERGGRTP